MVEDAQAGECVIEARRYLSRTGDAVPASIEHTIEIMADPERVWHVLTHGADYALQSDGTREVVTSV